MYGAKDSSIEVQKSTPIHYDLWGGGKFLKHIITYLCCTKYNEINLCHSDVQKHVSYKKWFKLYKYFVYRHIQKFFDTL